MRICGKHNAAPNGEGNVGSGAAGSAGGGFSSYRIVMAVLALNLPIVLLILMRNVGARGLTPLSWVYLFSVALGYYGLPILIVVTLLFVILMRAPRAAVFASWICVALFVYYLLIDSIVYGICKFHVDPFWVEFALRDSSGIGLTTATLVAAAALFPGIALMELGIFAIARRIAGAGRRALIYPALVLAAFAASQTLHAVTYERNDQRITALTPCLPAYVPVTSHGHASRVNDFLAAEDAEISGGGETPAKASMRYPLGELRFETPPREKAVNIVFLLLESWRYDAADERTTPNIYALGRSSTVCLDHMSSGNQTTCGIFGLFYGLQPTYWSTVKANSASIDNPVLIDVLKERGYAFGIFAKSKFERHKIKDTIFNGIDVFEAFSGKTIPEQDVDMTRRVIGFMGENARAKRPFMALAFFKSSHAPYEYPAGHGIFGPTKNVGLGLRSETDPAPYLADYRNSLHFVDALVGEIVDSLRAMGVFEKTVIVVTTDHGESFNEGSENFWGHGSNFTRNQVQVPLVFHAPGRAPRRIERRTSHVDVAPTVLGRYLGCISDPREYSNGIDLFDGSASPRALVIGSYVSHAFLLGNDVHEILPGFTKKYTLDGTRTQASAASPALAKIALEEISRFTK